MAPRNPQDPGDRRNPWTRPGYITAATFLGALVILAIILVATSGSGTTHTTQTQASNPTTTATTTQTPRRPRRRSANPGPPAPSPPATRSIPTGLPPPGTSGAGRLDEHPSSAHAPWVPKRRKRVYGTGASHTARPARCSLRSTSGLQGTAAIPAAGLPTPRDGRAPITRPRHDYATRSTQRARSNSPPTSTSPTRLDGNVDRRHQGQSRRPRGDSGPPCRWTGTDWRYAFPATGCSASRSLIGSSTGYVPWSAF